MNQDTTPSADLSPYITAIMERFKPARTTDEATHQLTTAEIGDAIREINPGLKFSTEQVFDALVSAGFSFHPIKGMQGLRFMWLLTEK